MDNKFKSIVIGSEKPEPLNRSQLASKINRLAIILLASLLLLAGLSGCQPLKQSEETLEMQLSEPEPDPELPVVQDVYDTSVEADVYKPDQLKLP